MEELLARLNLSPPVLLQEGYIDMLHDNDRMDKYFQAIKNAVKFKKLNGGKSIVLDIGTGSGLLAMMAASVEADVVYACEELPFMADRAKKVFKRNNFTSIKLVAKNSKAMQIGKYMTEKANILVTETFGIELLGEGELTTIKHAKENLLTDDCIFIPYKAVIYAQVVDCKMISNMNYIEPISLPNNAIVWFPGDMKTCCYFTNAALDMQISSLSKDQFSKLSNTLTVFEFDWKNDNLKEFDYHKIEFIGNREGLATAIFSWWELFMESSDENNCISLRPQRGCSLPENWRYHWMPQVHFGFTTQKISEGAVWHLETIYKERKTYFKINQDGRNKSDLEKEISGPNCICYIHTLMDNYSTGVLNSSERNSIYTHALQKLITPKETVVLCLSEPAGSVLYLMAAALGAKKVFVVETESKRGVCRYVTEGIVEFNKMESNIKLLTKPISELTKKDFDNLPIDLVIGDPFFTEVFLPDPYSCFYNRRRYIDEPWYTTILFGTYLETLEKNLVFPKLDSFRLMPFKAKLKGIALKFDVPLARNTASVKTVSDGRFDFQDFDAILQNSSSGISTSNQMNYEFLWQYPSIAASEVVDVCTLDLKKKSFGLRRNVDQLRVPIKRNADGFAFWVEWSLTETGHAIASNGLPWHAKPEIGKHVEWDFYKKQAVYYNFDEWKDNIRFKVFFENEFKKFTFEFSK